MVQQQSMTELSENRSTKLVTRSGFQLNVREAVASDELELLDFLHAVSPEDLRLRFLSSVRPSLELARELTRVDVSNAENLLAFDNSDGRLVATAALAAESGSATAEVAVLVRSDLKHR